MVVQIIHNNIVPNIAQIINPDTIQNRYDLSEKDYYVFLFQYEGKEYALTGALNGQRLNIGLWLVPLPNAILKQIFSDIFLQLRVVKQIRYQHSYSELGEQVQKGNHFKIVLPQTIKELQLRLSSKHRYNLRREKNIIENEIGRVEFIEFNLNIPDEIVNRFFEFKYNTHRFDYNLTARQYLDAYHVTDAYVLRAGDKILSIVFSCEQCAYTYIENLTYDSFYSKYSPGQVLYNYYLERLVEKGRKVLFLSGGELAYKRRYGSIEEVTYEGIVFKNKYWHFRYRLRLFLSAVKNKFRK